MTTGRPSRILLSLTGTLCLPGVVFAQGAGGATAQASIAKLEEVIVTAERREATAETTPISMAALSGWELSEQGIKTISDLETAVPAFAVSAAGTFNYINIRGIGNAVSLAGTTSGVAVIRDGLFEPDSSGLGSSFFDIASVQVLRGPQGTFVGQSSTGGAVLINSQNPKIGVTEGFVEASYGSFANTKMSGALNLPISDTFAARAAFGLEHRDSFYANLGSHRTPGDVNDQNARLGLLWQPSDNFRALLKVESNRSRNDGAPGSPIQNSYIDPVTGTEQFNAYYAFSTHDPYTLNYDYQNTYVDEDHDRYSLDAQYTFANGVALRSVTGYQHSTLFDSGDGDASAAPALTIFNFISPKKYYSEELTLISPTDGRFNWILGASTFHRDSTGGTEIGGVLAVKDIVTTRQYMAYGQLGFKFTDTLELQVGLRQNRDKTTDSAVVSNLYGEFTDSTPTGKIGLNWTPSPDQLFYAFVSRGYKAGGVNVGQADFEAEEVDDYELGWKGALFDDRIQLELGGYYMNFKNMQAQMVNLATGASNAAGNLSGSSIVKGLEAALNARFGDFGFDVNASYNDSKLGSVNLIMIHALPPSASNTPQCPTSSGPCFDYTPYYGNVSGSQNPYSPKLTFNAGVDYAFHLGANILRPSVRFVHIDKQYGSIFQADDYYLVEERNLWNAALNYEAGQWSVQAYGQNLTEETYVQGIFSGPAGLTAFYGAPRQLGLRVLKSF